MAVGKPEGSGGMVGGGPRGGFPGGAGRGTGRLRGVRKPSVRRTPRGGKKINDLTGKKKIYGDERGDWKMNLRQYNAFTPRTRRASVAKLSTYNEKTGNYAVAVNKNAPRTRAVVTAKNDAGTRRSSSRTSPRPSVKVAKTKKVLMVTNTGRQTNRQKIVNMDGRLVIVQGSRVPQQIKTVRAGTEIRPRSKKTINDHLGKVKQTRSQRKENTEELRSYNHIEQKSIRRSRTTTQKRLQRNMDYWNDKNIPKSARKTKASRNGYVRNKVIQANKGKLNRIAKKGGF
jgi:hypothetical protein